MLAFRKKRLAELFCSDCQKSVPLKAKQVELFVCVEDDWHSAVFVCPQCNCRRTVDLNKQAAMNLVELGCELARWSVLNQFPPHLFSAPDFYKPRPVPRSWLPFDEVDVVLLVTDMNTCDWWQKLAAYDPHAS